MENLISEKIRQSGEKYKKFKSFPILLRQDKKTKQFFSLIKFKKTPPFRKEGRKT